MVIFEDTRQKLDKNTHIREQLKSEGNEVIRNKLPVGDYCSMDNMRCVIDTKFGMQEIASNLTSDHLRFKRECELAQKLDIKLTILTQEEGIKTLEDVKAWDNPRLKRSQKAVTGDTLYKIMNTMTERYGVSWDFTTKDKCGEKIIQIFMI